ncbi:GlxA family transcriptional regulator [Neptunomonas sp.]|uniref:GlxA family transcriptional regulator n=1 Tax=Neptunomonas sp. TaxID=1971898 RepID=UPI0025E0D5E9|nr:GlxA family transcriptional regulator [Neptunomonas sp.]
MTQKTTQCVVDKKVIQVSFILLPGFALTSFALAIEALSVANLLNGSDIYQYQICQVEPFNTGSAIKSSNNVPIETNGDMDSCQQSDLIFICGYRNVADYNNPRFFTLLRNIVRRNGRIAALSCGSFILAKAGLLQDKSCTIVPEYCNTFAELYPNITLQENLYTISDNLLTSAGGTATLDMLLYLIGQDHGRDFAHHVSQQFLQERIRSREEMQTTRRYLTLRMKSPCLGAAVELMEKHISAPYPISTLASKIGTTQRNLETAFQKHEHTSPRRYYLHLRLQHARKMIQETHLSIANISQATGFSSQSHFSKCFREEFNQRPSELRLTNSSFQ